MSLSTDATIRDVLVAAAVATLAGCATSQTADDEAPTSETAGGSGSAADSQESTEEVPPVPDLPMRDEAPSPKKLGEKEGIRAYRVGDLKVLHKRTPANSVVSAKLYLDGGTAGLNDGNAGLEELSLRLAVNGGTESTSQDAFNSTLDSMGSELSSFAKRDYSGITLRSVSKHFDDSWRLFTEAVLEPALPPGELEVQRNQQLAALEQMRESPDQYVSLLARRVLTEGHPYQRLQLGTPENVQNFSRSDVVEYNRSLMDPSRMLLVVVGDIGKDELLEKVSASLGRLESQDWSRPSVPDLEAAEPRMEVDQRRMPTNYVLGHFPAPAPDEADYPATVLAMEYLSDNLFKKIRTELSLTYAVDAGVSSHRANSGYLYVSAQKPMETMKAIDKEVAALKNEDVSSTKLEQTRNVFITERYKSLETNANMASVLAQYELVAGDWRKYTTFLDRIREVTPEEVKAAVSTYMTNYQFGIVGRHGRETHGKWFEALYQQ